MGAAFGVCLCTVISERGQRVVGGLGGTGVQGEALESPKEVRRGPWERGSTVRGLRGGPTSRCNPMEPPK